eukprot:scaffold75961_cov23-Tisochrysis_lutea.AAC.1
MGSVGPVSVSVCAANTHQPFPVVTHGDKTYIVASPGLEYEVVLEMPVASSHPAHRLMIVKQDMLHSNKPEEAAGEEKDDCVDMDVDGLNVGYGQPLYGAVHGMKPKFDYLRVDAAGIDVKSEQRAGAICRAVEQSWHWTADQQAVLRDK